MDLDTELNLFLAFFLVYIAPVFLLLVSYFDVFVFIKKPNLFKSI